MYRYRLKAILDGEALYYMNIICVTHQVASAKVYDKYSEAQGDIVNFRHLLPEGTDVEIDVAYDLMSDDDIREAIKDTEERCYINDMGDDFAYTDGSHAEYERQISFLKNLLKERSK